MQGNASTKHPLRRFAQVMAGLAVTALLALGMPLNTTVQSVTDAAGAPVAFEVIDQGDSLELPLGTDDFVRGTQTGSVTARVHVDPGVTEFLTGDAACYSGGQGDTTACPVTDAASPDFGEMFTSTVQKLLPFAVLWGVERKWAKELVFLYEQGAPEPSWYGSQNGFSSRGFGNALGYMAGAVAPSSTVPHSSGGGGGGR